MYKQGKWATCCFFSFSSGESSLNLFESVFFSWFQLCFAKLWAAHWLLSLYTYQQIDFSPRFLWSEVQETYLQYGECQQVNLAIIVIFCCIFFFFFYHTGYKSCWQDVPKAHLLSLISLPLFAHYLIWVDSAQIESIMRILFALFTLFFENRQTPKAPALPWLIRVIVSVNTKPV